MDSKRLGEVVKMVAVYCPNRTEIHNGIYVKYVILVNKNGESLFIDDPSEQDLARLWARVSSDAEALCVASTCVICQALEGTAYEDKSS